MSTTSAISKPLSTPLVHANVKTIALLISVAFFSLLTVYFIGVDEGMISMFGKGTVLHELFHDGRHLLGFPCH